MLNNNNSYLEERNHLYSRFLQACKRVFSNAYDEMALDIVPLRFILTTVGFAIFAEYFKRFDGYYDCNGNLLDLQCADPNHGEDPLSPDKPFTPAELKYWWGDASSSELHEAAVYGFSTIATEGLWVSMVLVLPYVFSGLVRLPQSIYKELKEQNSCCSTVQLPDHEQVLYETPYTQLTDRSQSNQSQAYPLRKMTFRQYMAYLDPKISNISTVLALLTGMGMLGEFRHNFNTILQSIDCNPRSWQQIYFYDLDGSDCSRPNFLQAFTGAFVYNWMFMMGMYAISKQLMSLGSMAAYRHRDKFAALKNKLVNKLHNWQSNHIELASNLRQRWEKACLVAKNTAYFSYVALPVMGFAMKDGIQEATTIWDWGFCKNNFLKMAIMSPLFYDDLQTNDIQPMSESLPDQWKDVIEQQFNETVALPKCSLQQFELGYVGATMRQEILPIFFWGLPALMGAVALGLLYGCISAKPEPIKHQRSNQLAAKSYQDEQKPQQVHDKQFGVLSRMSQNLENYYVTPINKRAYRTLITGIVMTLCLVSFAWIDQIVNENNCNDDPAEVVPKVLSANCGSVESFMKTLGVLCSISWSLGSTTALGVGVLSSLWSTFSLLLGSLMYGPEKPQTSQHDDLNAIAAESTSSSPNSYEQSSRYVQVSDDRSVSRELACADHSSLDIEQHGEYRTNPFVSVPQVDTLFGESDRTNDQYSVSSDNLTANKTPSM